MKEAYWVRFGRCQGRLGASYQHRYFYMFRTFDSSLFRSVCQQFSYARYGG